MKISFLAFVTSTLLFASTIANPVPDSGSLQERYYFGCHPQTKLVRKEWRRLSQSEKKAYTDAVKCLAKKPSKAQATLKGAVSRFDDFQGIHSRQTDDIHWVGFFLPWHRYHIHLYEKALRMECGYKGAQPYWDWTIDIKSGKPMEQWPIFDAKYGFGGNGPFVPLNTSQNPFGIEPRTGGGCVQDGPFTFPGFSLSLGPSTDPDVKNPHCLTRDFAPEIAKFNLQQAVVDECLGQPTYGHFARRMESVPSFDVPTIHGGGHFGVGGVLGTIGNAYNSPGDPIFYLHHGNLDRIWWLWQRKDLKNRLTDISGPILPFDYDNARGGNVTLDFKINLGQVGPEVTMWHLLNIQGGVLCYDYQ